MTEREQRVPADLSPNDLRSIAGEFAFCYSGCAHNRCRKYRAVKAALRFLADAREPSAEMVERAAQWIARRRYGLPGDVVRVQDSERETARAVLAAIVGRPDAS